MRSLPRPLVAAAVAAALLTACGGDDPEVGSLPALTPTPTPTASATPAGLTAADLERVAREYYAALVETLQTNDMAPYAAVTSSSCECFASVKETVEDWRRRGVRSDVQTRVLNVVDPRLDGPDSGRIGVVFEEPPSTLKNAAGEVVENATGTKPRQEELRIAKVDGRLKVVDNLDLGLVGA